MNNPIQEFMASIADSGLTPPAKVEADGRLHRFSSSGRSGDTAGWYVFFGDQPAAGAYGCWRTGIDERWRSNGSSLSPSDREKFRIRQRSLDAARAAEIETRRASARSKADQIWRASDHATSDHPYLVAKGVQPQNLRIHGNDLVARLMDGPDIHSLQFIRPDGKKRFLPDGRKQGCYHSIGKPEETILICEGVSTGLSLHEATGQAVAIAFDAGNLLPVAESLRASYPDIRLVVCADDDFKTEGNPGLTKGQEAAAEVNGFLAVPDFGSDRPDAATDFNDLASHLGIDAVAACVDRAESFGWPAPQPLPNPIPEVMPFDSGLLPPKLAPWVKDIADRMQCPPDFPAVGLIVAISAVVGRQIAIRPKEHDDWSCTPNLWGGICGRPGLLKTPALQEVLKPIERLETRAREEHEQACLAYEAQQMVAEAREKHVKDQLRKAVKNGEDAEGLAMTAIADHSEPPGRRRYVLHDTTPEKLGEILRDNPRGILLFRDELSAFLRSLDREGYESARGFYMEAWAGSGPFSYDRIGRGSIFIEAVTVSILGGIQPGPLSAYLNRALRGGADDDGFLQRLQVVVWPDTPKNFKNVDRRPDVDARSQAFDIFDQLDQINPQGIGAEVPESGLPFLRFAPDAQKVFNEWRAQHEPRLRAGDMPPVLESHLAKYRSLIPSLALLIHLADGGTGPVCRDSLLRALAWADYLESHARRIYAPALAPDLSAAALIGDRISRGHLETGFTARSIQRKGWSGLTERATIQEALDLLAELEWLREVKTPTPGRTKTSYNVNPRIEGT